MEKQPLSKNEAPSRDKVTLDNQGVTEVIRNGARERMVALRAISALTEGTEFGTHKPTEEEVWDFGHELSENTELEQQFLRLSSRILALRDLINGLDKIESADDEWSASLKRENDIELAEIAEEIRRLSQHGDLEKYLGVYRLIEQEYQKFQSIQDEYRAVKVQKSELVTKSGAVTNQAVKSTLLNRRRFLEQKEKDLEGQLAYYLGSEGEDAASVGVTEIKYLDQLDRLSELAQSLESNRFVVTHDLEPTYDQVKSLMQNGQPVLLIGPHGSGKTELLRYCANQLAKEKHTDSEKSRPAASREIGKEGNENYYIFSGSKESSVYDLVGKLKITTVEQTAEEKIENFTKEYRKMVADGLIHPDHQVKEGTIDFIQMALQAYPGGETKTKFSPGVLVRALKEGKPLIVDEIDQIPQEVLARINDILTRKVGDKVIIQENGEEEIEIAPGFLVVATGNIKSDKYERQKLDPAFTSRFTTIEHQYLTKRDAFDVLLANFFDAKDKKMKTGVNIEELYPKLIRLVVAMNETQDIFLGKYKTASLAAAKTENVNKTTSIAESPITIRSLMKVLKDFQSSTMTAEDFDYSVGVGTLMIPNKADKKAILEILLRSGFFQGWSAEDFYQQYNLDVDKDFLDIIRALANEGGDADPYQKAINEADQAGRLTLSNKYF